MTELNAAMIPTALVIIAFALPLPHAQGISFMVDTCLGQQIKIDLPANPMRDKSNECCRKACHIGGERRKHLLGDQNDCC